MSRMSVLSRSVWTRAKHRMGMAWHSGRVDAFLASYPKSGRTWFRFILSSYLASSFDLPVKPDLYSMFTVMPNFDMDPTRGLPAFAFATHEPAPPLIAVSHLAYSRRRFGSDPVIFMVRDPRDVMVSSYFHATRQKHRFSGDIDGFLRDPVQGISSLTRYLNDWSAGLAHRRHIVLSYEDLTRDPRGQTARVLDFLNIGVDPATLARVVDAAGFRAMQDLELTRGLPGHDYDIADTESRRMRRGKVGGFDDYLSPEQIGYVQAVCARDLTPRAKALFGQPLPG